MNRYAVLKGIFEALAVSRLPVLLRKVSRAKGIIFTLHRVVPGKPADFAPNAILQITPSFLESVVVAARGAGFDIVDLDEAMRRVRARGKTKPFIVLTFDDGYRDNLVHALPILRRHETPFTLYIPTALVDGVGQVWWQALEDIIAAHEHVTVNLPDGVVESETRTTEQKSTFFNDIYVRYRQMPEPDRVASISDLAGRYGFDLDAHCRSLIMDWDELRTFANEPLCTIGAHTVHHYELSKLPEGQMREEIARSADILESKFGARPRHLSYPIGGPEAAGQREFAAARDLGFTTAVTTRPGGLYAEHGDHAECLPRVSLNGNFQERRFIDVFLCAEVFRLMRKGRVLDVE